MTLRTASLVAAALATAASAPAQDSDAPSRRGHASGRPLTSAVSSGSPAELIFTNIPGLPESQVPGLPGVVFDPGTGTTDFGRVFGSPNGNWILTAFADLATSEDELVLVNGSLALQEGQPAPWIAGAENTQFIDTRCEINDSGDFTLTVNTDGDLDFDDFIVTNIGGVWGFAAREGDPIAALPGNTYDLLESATILADGSIGLVSDGIDGTFPTSEDEIFELGGTILSQEGITVPTGQAGGATEFVENFDFEDVFASEDGMHWMYLGDLTGSTSSDDVVVVDGAVVLQEGSLVPGSGFPNPIDSGGIVGVFMDAAGNWYARGNNDVSEVDWLVRNGVVVATLGQPITLGAVEAWDDTEFSACFFLHVGNGVGDYVIGGVSNGPADANGVLVLNGTEVICREGDPVDLDGNGFFDDDAFIDTFGNDDAHLTDDGTFFMVVTIQDGAGTRLGQAFMSLDLGGVGTNYCTAVANSTGVPASIGADGSDEVASNDLTLICVDMPQNAAAIFITSQAQGFVTGPGGSMGNLCLGGSIGRFVGPGQVQNSGATGSVSLVTDLTMQPTPTGLVAVMPGETWNYQCWFRDAVGGMATSNFSDGLEVLFQ